ncbi:MAG: dihydropteroate synthase [Rickettsiales bacterium]|nr:dihydropteroate synthase [Rickettsiales bacterium]
MYKYFLALGSNIGEIDKNIDNAIKQLKNIGCKIIKIAPFYYTKPLLPPNADESYNKIFCNTAVEIEVNFEPFEMLHKIKQIETIIGREPIHKLWSPRIIDIDILYCEKQGLPVIITTAELIIPHKELFNRAFVLDPLSHIAPNLSINGKNILTESKKQLLHQSVIMAIVNVNNNSFSGDGSIDANINENKIHSLVEQRVAFIDIGAESTNPKSSPISANEELNRLKTADIFSTIKKYKTNGVRFSIDTYHPETAEFCIKNGFDVINDVNGFKNTRMWKIMQENSQSEAVIMHSIVPNGDKKNVLPENANIIAILNEWVIDVEKKARENNIDKNRIIIDYGIGFGKTAEQDLFIINNIDKIDNRGFRVLIGHSMKSFMKILGVKTDAERQDMTKKISSLLTKKGVDVLRLHRLMNC